MSGEYLSMVAGVIERHLQPQLHQSFSECLGAPLEIPRSASLFTKVYLSVVPLDPNVYAGSGAVG